MCAISLVGCASDNIVNCVRGAIELVAKRGNVIFMVKPYTPYRKQLNPLSTDGHYSGHMAKFRFLQNWQI